MDLVIDNPPFATLNLREFKVILKKRKLVVLKMTKNLHRRVLSPASMGSCINICIHTIILIKTSQKSKTRKDYLTFHNNDFVALYDHLSL